MYRTSQNLFQIKHTPLPPKHVTESKDYMFLRTTQRRDGKIRDEPFNFHFHLASSPSPGCLWVSVGGGPRGVPVRVSQGGLRGLGGGAEGSRRMEGPKFRAFFLSRLKFRSSLSLFFFCRIVAAFNAMVHQCACLGFSGVILCEPRARWRGVPAWSGPAEGSPVEGSRAVQWRGKKGKMKNRKTFTKNKSKEGSKPNPVRFQECKPNLFVLKGLNRTLRFPGKGEGVQPF